MAKNRFFIDDVGQAHDEFNKFIDSSIYLFILFSFLMYSFIFYLSVMDVAT